MKDYKLLLPKTDFPMKAKLPTTEPERIQKWSQKNLYQKMIRRREKAPVFFMPDGPPYANGAIHIGHTLNKVLKDIVIKYKNLKGFQAPFIPSWDCHGLPIELATLKKQKELKLSHQDLRKECKKTALYWVEEQKKSFQRLGVLADWDQYLLTLDPLYSAEQLRAFAKMVEKGLIFSGRKPVFWCFKLETALAFSEAEYRDHESPSIYVKFDLSPESAKKINSSKPLSAVVWTTTPWTLPANTAICLHPDLEYGVFSSAKESYLLCVALAESFFKEIGVSDFKREKVFKGKELEYLVTQHPFLDSKSPLILGEHVGQEAGTGLVHTAPGHGLEDHAVGLKYKLPMPCPVSGKGHFTESAPDFLKGLFILKGNSVIIEKLKETGHLLGLKKITHSYPYNPRANSPLIYRLTPQWFLSLDGLARSVVEEDREKETPLETQSAQNSKQDTPPKKQNETPHTTSEETGQEHSVRKQALKACDEEIEFVPDWGKSRLTSMIENSPDWCLSRQRVWGVPLVVFYCKSCSKPLLSAEIINNIAEKVETHDLDFYFDKSAKELLPKDQACESCGAKDFKKGEDILDVWFDSGIQHEVFSKKKNLKIPFDLFLEGSDQHRGWFQTSLLSSMALNSKSPFKTLLTHGFVMDQRGHKMSKSKGNVIDPEKLIQQSGAEILRLWVASENFAFDMKAGDQNFKRVIESYRRYRNTFRFLLGNLNDFSSESLVSFSKLRPVDQWMMIQLGQLITSVIKDYEDYAFYRAYQKFNHFFTVTLSSFYLDIIKDRLYTFSKESLERRQAQTVLYHLLDHLPVLMAPITSFLSEEVYFYFNKKDKKESVFLEDFPDSSNFSKLVSQDKTTEEIEKLFSRLFPLREELNKKLESLRREAHIRSNLQAQAIWTLKEDFISKALSEEEQLEFFSISQIKIQEGNERHLGVKKAEGEKCVRCWFISLQLNAEKICPKCVRNL